MFLEKGNVGLLQVNGPGGVASTQTRVWVVLRTECGNNLIVLLFYLHYFSCWPAVVEVGNNTLGLFWPSAGVLCFLRRQALATTIVPCMLHLPRNRRD